LVPTTTSRSKVSSLLRPRAQTCPVDTAAARGNLNPQRTAKMKLDKVANSKNDEFYTPRYAVEPIIKHLKISGYKSIRCPFDTDKSNFVKMLRREGFEVINTHIDSGVDFFNLNFSDCDCVVSNPPYSIKGDVFKHLFNTGVPFAMLVGVVGLFESQSRFEMFKDNPFEIMYMNRRVSYMKDYESGRTELNPPFSSVYLCRNVLYDRIVFEELDKKNI